MRKLLLPILCLFLAACGTFAIKVEIVSQETATSLPGTNLTKAVATTYAAATAYSSDPDGQSRMLTQAAATVMAEIPQATETPHPIPIEATATLVEVTPTPWTLPAGEAISLGTIQMSDMSRGWGVESTGHIVKTVDGGWRWKDVTPFHGTFNLHSLFALNNETAWAVPSKLQMSKIVWNTRDGGVTWEASQPIPLGDGNYSPLGLQFPDARHGWLMILAQDDFQGKHVLLYKSNDGGENWEAVSKINTSQSQSYLPDTNTTMAFFDGQTGWIGGWWGKDNPNQWLILKTVDGGANWGTEELELPKLNSLSCDGHPIANMQPGSMAVEMTCTLPKDPKYFYHHIFYLTTKISPTWRSWALSGEFLAADFLNDTQGWMMVTTADPLVNEIRYSKNRGKDWTTLGEVSWKQAQFDFFNVREGWALAGSGYSTGLVRTDNGGKVWVQVWPVAEP